MFYIGSCRYMEGYKWDYFPARLHTTREILFFLQNIDGIQALLETYPKSLRGKIFGDIYHPDLAEKSKVFMSKTMSKQIGKLILEISSRSVCYYKDTPLNDYNVRSKEATCSEALIRNYKLTFKELSDAEIEKDIEDIYKLSKKIFTDVELHIIPHLSLKTRLLNDYIPKRHAFVLLLEKVCKKLTIHFHNIGAYLESVDQTLFLEDYMADSRHYSNRYEKVKDYLFISLS